MKMRFWQKTYVFTLCLFLLCLNAGVLSLSVYTYQKSVNATESAFAAEQYFIKRSFEMDYAEMTRASKNQSPSLLMQTYSAYYEQKGLLFEFRENGNAIHTCFDEAPSLGKNAIAHKELDGVRYIFISSELCDGKYEFIFAKCAQSIDEEFASLMTVYTFTVLGVSAVLAVSLYYILKRLSIPLEKLRATTDLIENGELSVVAEEKGSDEVVALARSINRMLGTIKRQMESLEADSQKKQMLVDNMAHELRTPLTVIYGYAELLEKTELTDDDRIAAIKYILSETKRLKKISELMLDSAFLRENTVYTEKTDLAEILNNVAERLSPKAQKAKVFLLCETEKTIINGNSDLLSLLFYNLTENAIKACKSNGTVRLSCKTKRACVEDNGKGITEEQLLHITEPFYRTDNARSRADGGAGLGLALCKRICDSHNARMSFESKPNEGTKVTVSFTS